MTAVAETSDAVVVGAGVVGCATAYWLARAGLSVTVVERDRIAQHGSSLPASVLAPLSAGDFGPLADAGWASLAILLEVESELEDEASFEPRIARSGVMRLADASQRQAAVERAVRLADRDCRWLDRDELAAWDPRIDSRWIGALWSPRECSVDTRRLARTFARAAEHHGATFAVETPVLGLAMSHGCVAGVLAGDGQLYASGDVVLCGGAWSGEFGDWLGVCVPVEAARVAQVGVPASEPNPPGIICANDLQLIPGERQLWIGASPDSVESDPGDLAWVERGAELWTGLRSREPNRNWSGANAHTPDRLPLVGRIPGVEGVMVATGFGRQSALLSALAASGIVEHLVEGTLPGELAPFAPDRF